MLVADVPMIVIGLVLLLIAACLFGPALLENIVPGTHPDQFHPTASAAFEPHLWANRADVEEGLL